MSIPQIVIDTNVFVAALMSRRGASYKLLMLLGQERFELNISVALVLEYEDVAMRKLDLLLLPEARVIDILDYVCAIAQHQSLYYLWRPVLRDPSDDMVLELAVASGSQYIVTFNIRDFIGSERFGVEAVTPREFLLRIGELS